MEQVLFVALQIVIVIASITIHEFSHGYAAYKLGDDTAKRAGRLTLNPIKHLDLLGALMLLIVKIGWAKPVPINPYNFRNMKIDTALTAAAGPASNFIFAILAAMCYNSLEGRYADPYQVSLLTHILIYGFKFTVIINIALGLFNLIPIPPLDGSKIVGGFMTDNMYFKWMEWEKKGAYLLMIIFGISFFLKIPLIGTFIMPPLDYFTKLLIGTGLK